MMHLTADQAAYLDFLLHEPPGKWPKALQVTATDACREVQASYEIIRAIVAAWIVDGGDRVMTSGEIAALQPEVDLRPSMS